MESTKNATTKTMTVFRCDDVRVTFLLQVSMILSIFFDMVEKASWLSALKASDEVTFSKRARSFCSEHVPPDCHGDGGTRSQGVVPVLILDGEMICEVICNFGREKYMCQ